MLNESLASKAIQGGVATIVAAFWNETLAHMIPWLIVSLAVIICDLAFGIRKSLLMDEEVRFSRAVRATMGKIVTYFSFVCMVCSITVAAEINYRIDVYACLLVCCIEGCSIVGNILRPKGIHLNPFGLLVILCRKVFKVDREDVKEILQEK